MNVLEQPESLPAAHIGEIVQERHYRLVGLNVVYSNIPHSLDISVRNQNLILTENAMKHHLKILYGSEKRKWESRYTQDIVEAIPDLLKSNPIDLNGNGQLYTTDISVLVLIDELIIYINTKRRPTNSEIKRILKSS